MPPSRDSLSVAARTLYIWDPAAGAAQPVREPPGEPLLVACWNPSGAQLDGSFGKPFCTRGKNNRTLGTNYVDRFDRGAAAPGAAAMVREKMADVEDDVCWNATSLKYWCVSTAGTSKPASVFRA